MHAEAYEWVGRYATSESVTVLDIGGRDINGSPRGHFPNATYTVLDILAGPDVDIVADAASWTPDQQYDLVVCCETFEHTAAWRQIAATLVAAVKPEGAVILTMAGPGRAPHSAFDGGPLYADEYYGNVDPEELRQALRDAGFRRVVVDIHEQACDVRAWASRTAA